MHRIANSLTVAPFVVAVVVANLAQAQADEAGQTAAARVLFVEGVEHADGERWPEAEDRFRRALDLKQSPVAAFNLAAALEPQGKLVEAAELWRKLELDAAAPEDMKQEARRRRDGVAPRIARLRVDVEGPTDNRQILLDERPLSAAEFGIPLPVDPGLRLVLAREGDTELARHEVTLGQGASASLVLRLPPPAPVVEPSIAPAAAAEPRPALALAAGTATEPADRDSGTVFESGWFWVAVAVVLAGSAVAVGVALSDGDDPKPFAGGNFDPPLFEVEVLP